MPRLVVLVVCAGLAACSAQRAPGEPCRDGDCAEGSVCARVTSSGDGVDECIALCDPPGDEQPARCEGGELCYWARSDRLDLWGCFPGGEIPIGAACSYPTDCVRGAFCLIRDPEPPTGECAPVCNPGGCGLSEPCAALDDCADGLVCTAIGTTGTLADTHCAITCEPATSGAPYLCPDGAVCWRAWELSTAPWACYPGGATPLGASCSVVSECERGTICVGDPPEAICVRACSGDSDCAVGERCRWGLCTT